LYLYVVTKVNSVRTYVLCFALSLKLSDGVSRFSRDINIGVEYRTVALSNNRVVDFELHKLRMHVFRTDNEDFVHIIKFVDVENDEYVIDRKMTFKTSVRLLDFSDDYTCV